MRLNHRKNVKLHTRLFLWKGLFVRSYWLTMRFRGVRLPKCQGPTSHVNNLVKNTLCCVRLRKVETQLVISVLGMVLSQTPWFRGKDFTMLGMH